MNKNPIAAAILNFFLFGGGTMYVGKRFAIGLLITLGGMTAQIAEILISPPVYNLAPSIWPFLLGGIVVLKIGLAVDGYQEASR